MQNFCLYLDIVKINWAGWRRTQTKFVFLLANLKPLSFPVHNKTSDAPVPLQKKNKTTYFKKRF